jgi:hypothetical protein
MPPDNSEEAIASCASLSQLLEVAEAALIGAIAMRGPGQVCFNLSGER